jgi:hypothetical protein
MLSAAVSFSVGMLFVMHTFFLVLNYSTIEVGGLGGFNPFGHVKEVEERDINSADNMRVIKKSDWMRNWTDFFGKSPKGWFLPNTPKDRTCDGMNWVLHPSPKLVE